MVRSLRSIRIANLFIAARIANLFIAAPFVLSLGLAHSQNTVSAAQAAFSVNPVHRVTLSGTASWYAGSLSDSGPVTLEASSSGAATTTLQLAASGAHIESQTGIDSSMSCRWSVGDGIEHTSPSYNCWKSMVWFLPSVAFQPSLLPETLGISDLGSARHLGHSVKHVQGQLVFTDMPVAFDQRVLPDTTADLMLNTSSFLPEALTYTVHPDAGTMADIPVEVRFADYRKVNGAEIPFSIQRYFNGTLQLDIAVTTATVN